MTTNTYELQEGVDLAENSSEDDDQNSEHSSIASVDPPPLNWNCKTGQIPNNTEYPLLNVFRIPTDNIQTMNGILNEIIKILSHKEGIKGVKGSFRSNNRRNNSETLFLPIR